MFYAKVLAWHQMAPKKAPGAIYEEEKKYDTWWGKHNIIDIYIYYTEATAHSNFIRFQSFRCKVVAENATLFGIVKIPGMI